MPATVMALSLTAFLFVDRPALAMAQMMSLPGKAAVDPNGGAGYSIPISVPPGTAGLAPTLSFQYNNQSGDGLLGIGWSLGGLPAVSRCPQTVAQDGVMGRVNYDANDRFCLDGQRLMAINNGTYGADGTEYQTEIESFSRVISHGTAGTGPAWFEVHTKSGQIMEFGNTADSQVLAQGTTTVRSWAVNKVSDTKGNYFTVTYTQDVPNGMAYPARVDYTGNAGASLQPYNSVQFVYAPRPDITALYHAGSLMETTQRLTDVKTYAGNSLVADYSLAYSTTITNVSILTSITLCAGDGSCLPPTSFTVTDSNAFAAPSGFTMLAGQSYGTTLLGTSPQPVSGPYAGGTFTYQSGPNGGNFGTPPSANYLPIAGDFDGDGKTDFGFAAADAIYVMLSNGNGTFLRSKFIYPNGWNFGSPPQENYWPIVGDFDGDGKTDFAFSSGTAIYVMFSNGDGTFSGSKFIYPNGWDFGGLGSSSYSSPMAGDFDGDGRTDFAGGTAVYVLFSKGDGTFSGSSFTYPIVPNTGTFGSPPQINYWSIVGDFDGDGKTDFSFTAGTAAFVMRSNGDGSFSESPFTYPNYQPLTNSSVYTKGSGSTYPIADVQAPIYVVSRVDSSNGIGGNFSAGYAYTTAKMDRSGRGFLGFWQVSATDLLTNIVKSTTYRQDYPYIALVASETQSLSGATLNTTNNAYGFTALGGTRYQLFLTESQASSVDLDGSALPTVTTSYQYDAFGNATQVVVSATDGHSKTTNNTYTNDTTNWLLGRLILLRHNFHLRLAGLRRAQHGHRGRLATTAAPNMRWIVAIELGT